MENAFKERGKWKVFDSKGLVQFSWSSFAGHQVTITSVAIIGAMEFPAAGVWTQPAQASFCQSTSIPMP